MAEPNTPTADKPALQTIGILGGMSSESTVTYYQRLNSGVNEALGGHHSAPVLINSVDFGVVEGCIRDGRWDDAGEYLAERARELESGGADFVVMATNTMHRVAPAITDALSIPFHHIVDAAADAAIDDGLDTVGVLGTKPVTQEPFYRERFAENGLDVVLPDADACQVLHDVIFDELTRGVITDESREAYLDSMDDLVDRGAQGIVLGCTEIELLVSDDDFSRVPLLDTTELHVQRALELCLPDEVATPTP
ncbi:aspartate/glutamate racemase family protein [Haloarchaeobius sp. DYHT-AS-18]|uniref:aspartate/glutamate racemase family protein n=1 Tax=Haloarchaeobius sp. DYHT-AS-18 TaxID=3446117 RepID=UPI003EC04BE7